MRAYELFPSPVSGIELVRLAKSMGIEKPHKVATGAEKTQVKQRIRALKAERAQAGTAHDTAKLAKTRHEIHRLKRKLRRMSRLAG